MDWWTDWRKQDSNINSMKIVDCQKHNAKRLRLVKLLVHNKKANLKLLLISLLNICLIVLIVHADFWYDGLFTFKLQIISEPKRQFHRHKPYIARINLD